LGAHRNRHEGTVYKRKRVRKDGTIAEIWCGRISAGRGANGKHRRIVVYGQTKASLVDKMAALRTRVSSGLVVTDPRRTLAVYLDWWIEQAGVRDNTRRSYKSIAELHIKPYIGQTALQRVSPAQVHDLYAQLERGGASARMRQLVHAVLHRTLSQALKLGLVTRNVCDAVEPPKATAPPMRVWNADEVRLFLAGIKGDPLEALYVLALATGMRQGELLGLQWADVDFDGAALSVRRTLLASGRDPKVGPPKSKSGDRRIDLPASVVTALWSHKKLMLSKGRRASMWVFCDRRGGPLHAPNVVRRSFFPLIEGINKNNPDNPLPRIRFHDLRHTAATLLLAAGVHPKVVQERLGHAQVTLTLSVYSHVLPSMQREAAARIDDLFALTKSS
jgi:integrase